MSKPSSSVLLDALPYVDQGYDEAARSATSVMKTELERIHNRQPMEMLSMKRYELPGPAAGKLTDVGAWQDSMSNAQAQLEHQSTRLINLDLMTEYGPETWRSYNEFLQRMLNNAHKQLGAFRKEIQEIHYDRKRKQTETGERLRNLEASWVGLVAKNYEIEKACVDLESKLEPMRKKFKPTNQAESAGD